ncbi:hypothetical protein [uncultured Desulfovibrio sp.]|uniref:DUF883 family protein n=1 Tax=uncultured Desulfovibrio sp. TaxID=167968 RepID=UPI002803ACFA|nr:hypothetical protein [uncultured Desulfovibrio sp.]
MVDNHDHTVEDLRKELGSLRAQMETLFNTLKEKKADVAGDVSSRIADELGQYRRYARDGARKVYDAGAAGVEEVSEQVRRNPLASLLIAFGAGCVLSGLFRHFR